MRLRVAAVLVVVASVGLWTTPAALACRVDTTLDKPTYPPGSAAMITGFASGPGAETARTVRFTWGEGGPLLGEAPVGADGAISFSFIVPADLAAGSYPIYAEAFDADGADITPLPGSMLLVVETPPAPATSASVGEEQVVPTRARPSILARAPIPAEPAAQPLRTRSVGSTSAARPSSRVVPKKPAQVEAAPAPLERRAKRPRPKPAARKLEKRLPAPAAAQPSAGPSPRVQSAEADERRLPTALLLLLLVPLAGCAALFAWRRGPAWSTGQIEITSDEIEAELQEIIAEERARRSELVGHR